MTLTMKRLSIAILATMVSPVYADEQKHHFNIPAQALGSALQTLAKQSGAPMLYAEQTAAGRRSSGLNGNYTTREATGKLLAGSGLSYDVAADGTVTVKPAPVQQKLPPAITTLAPMTVVGEAAQDPNDPYNESYTVTNSSIATKTDTPIFDTPVSVQVVPRSVMDDQKTTRLARMLWKMSAVCGHSQHWEMAMALLFADFAMAGCTVMGYWQMAMVFRPNLMPAMCKALTYSKALRLSCLVVLNPAD